MATFTPPVNASGVPSVLPVGDPEQTALGYKLFRHYKARPEGVDVFLYSDGSARTTPPDSRTSFWSAMDTTRTTQPYVTHAFWGGHAPETITTAEAALLTAAGFGANIT